jgi:Pyridoxamine 5'-phosphate oxidase
VSGPEPQATRPNFTPGYGIDPAKVEGLLPWIFVTERMAAARNYWVATTRSDGRPHVAPVWGLWLDDAFYFSTDPKSVKGRNLARSSEVAVHLESGDEAVILEGSAERWTDQAELTLFADAYDAKYQFRPDPTNPDQGVYRLKLRTAFAWTEKDFLNTPTRWTFS